MNDLTVFHIYDETNKEIYTKFMRLDDKISSILNDYNITEKKEKYIFSYNHDRNHDFNNTCAKDYEINSFFYLKKY